MVQNLLDESSRMEANRAKQLDQVVENLGSIQLSQSSLLTKLDLEDIGHTLNSSISAAANISKEIEILKSLCFKSMTVRHSKITEAYCKTFDWILNSSNLPPTDPRSRIRFANWLRSSRGIYWISGKAGSGKSTLMKYIIDNQTTTSLLREWSESIPLTTASFFFWNAGTDMQKSQQGLLQSLLYEVLSKCPDLIPTICPSRWKSRNPTWSSFRGSADLWQLSELIQAFNQLKSQAATNTKFCFFIDGLDEYEGDHCEIIDILNDMVTAPNIKICLSSRPWNCFEDAFGKDFQHKLYLQDLTREDIEHYAQGKLQKHLTTAISGPDDIRYRELILEIVDRAQGVFLWVFLVVRSLREGLVNRDSISILQKRLRSLPTDLEAFFEHILNSIDKVYQENLAFTFQVALQAPEPLHLITYSYLDEEKPDFAIKAPIGPIDIVETRARQKEIQRRLNGRSKGLLEVSIWDEDTTEYFKYGVDFLHRTVRDFLMTRDMQIMLDGRIVDSHNPCAAASKALLTQMKTMPGDNFSETLESVMYFARQGELQTGFADVALLEELKRVCQIRCRYFLGDETAFIRFAVKKGVVKYVSYKLDQHPYLLMYKNISLLESALGQRLAQGKYEIDLTGMVRMLLKRGSKPNQRSGDTTLWRRFLDSYPESSIEAKEHEYWLGMLKLLLLYGADIRSGSHLLDKMMDLNSLFQSNQNSSVQMVRAFEILLSHGLDPNWTVSGTTVWGRYLARVLDIRTFFVDEILLGITRAFLRYGADPNLKFSYISDDIEFQTTASKAIRDKIIRNFTRPEDASALKNLLASEIKNIESQDQYFAGKFSGKREIIRAVVIKQLVRR
jgi:hypothetical protein